MRIGNLFSLRLILVAVIILPLASAVVGAYLLWRSTEDAAWQDLEWRVGLAVENANRVFETDMLVLHRMDDMTHSMSDDYLKTHESELSKIFSDIAFDLPRIHDLFITGVDGTVFATANILPVPIVNMTDREYFKDAQIDSGPIISGRLIGRGDGASVIVMSLRRTTDGHFNGVLGAAMSLGYFEKSYLETHLADPGSEGVAVGIYKQNGDWLIRVPAPEQYSAKISASVREHIKISPLQGRYREVSILNNQMRLGAYRKVGEFPIYVGAAISQDLVIQHWIEGLLPYLYFCLPMLALLIAVVALALRRTQAVLDAAKLIGAEQIQRRAAEQAANAAHKMEIIGRLAGGIAHDFNNSLGAIIGHAELALIQPERRERALQVVLEAANKAARLIARLMAFSRASPTAPVVLSLKLEVQRIADTLLRPALAGMITLSLELTDEPCLVEIDPMELEMALLNLSSNARDAMPRGGHINVKLEVQGEEVCLSVNDTGEGMTPKVIERAFEPFFTTKEIGQGSGIGLAQVAALAQQSGGTATIASQVGVGTCVTLTFPLTTKRIALVTDTTRVVERPSAVTRVLLVEDDFMVAEILQDLLIDLNCEVIVVDRVQAAIDRLTANADVDLVLSDIRMPGGMNGVDLAKFIEQRWPQLPVVLLTGYADEQRIVGFNRTILQKPIQRALLAQMLTSIRTRRQTK